jgi:D-alanyl-lipoteichoic acid acyltransferase DltB (MBOAT superfamily)
VAENLRHLAVSATASVLGTALFLATFTVPWERYGFALEHTAKVVTFFLMIVPLSAAQAAAWRLAGGRGLEFMDNPFAARTPADFWRRYNRPVHQFLEEDLFVPAGGRRHRVRATIAVFLFSAVIHEYVFAVGVGRVQGYQAAFFLVQGLAVAATLRVRPKGPWVAPCVAGTFAFNVVSGVLFFGSVNGLLPFYRNRVPLWH